MTNRVEKAHSKVASIVSTLQQNFDGANVDTITAIAKHWAAYLAIGAIPDEETDRASAAIDAEVSIKCDLLSKLTFSSPADTRAVARYLAALDSVDEWWLDTGAIKALTDGMRRAVGPAPGVEHPWVRARRLAWELATTLAQCDDGQQVAIITPAHGSNKPSVFFGDRELVAEQQAS